LQPINTHNLNNKSILRVFIIVFIIQKKMFKNNLCACKNLVLITRRNLSKDHYKLIVVGGGSGGLATASKFKRALGAENIAIVEPSDIHCKYFTHNEINMSVSVYFISIYIRLSTWMDPSWRRFKRI
jgi:hypothetical protein